MRELEARIRGVLATAMVSALLLAGLGLLAPQGASAQSSECSSTIDLMLVLDGSESIVPADFETMRGFVSDLVGHFTVSPDDANVGIVQFAGQGQGRIEVQVTGDEAAVQGAIASMTQIVGATDIQEGVAYGQGELALSQRGVPQVMIVMTDGVHNQPGDPVGEALAARQYGTQIYSIAVGPGPDVNQLLSIAGDADRVFTVDSYDALVTILDPLVEVVCPQIDPPDSEVTDPPGSQPGGPPMSDVLPSTLPATGAHDLPPDWPEKGRSLFFQAAIGMMAAGLLMVGAYVVGSRR
jgi:collagen type VI alpha